VGSLIFAPGKLTCFFPAIAPLSRTSQVILFPRPILRIFNSIAPLSRDIFPPFLIPLTYLRLSICNDFFPLIFLFGVRTSSSPFFSSRISELLAVLISDLVYQP